VWPPCSFLNKEPSKNTVWLPCSGHVQEQKRLPLRLANDSTRGLQGSRLPQGFMLRACLCGVRARVDAGSCREATVTHVMQHAIAGIGCSNDTGGVGWVGWWVLCVCTCVCACGVLVLAYGAPGDKSIVGNGKICPGKSGLSRAALSHRGNGEPIRSFWGNGQAFDSIRMWCAW
jgi:hypothetical protein